jgi:DNA-binding NarL/FixJ family response regulator
MQNPVPHTSLQDRLQLSAITIERLLRQRAFRGQRQKQFNSLTRRQREILTMICCGKTNRQIGKELFIAEDTVRTHRNNIWRQLGIRTVVEAVWFGQAFELV